MNISSHRPRERARRTRTGALAASAKRASRGAIGAAALAVLVAGWLPAAGAAAQCTTCRPGPRILVLRGIFEVFSLGMNDLANKLQALGYDATCTSWSLALTEIDCADDRPIVVVGHSMGGRACGWVSRELRKCGKRVPLIVIVDANLWQAVPDNVDRCVHLFVTNELGVFHGTPVRGESACTQIVNWDVSRGQKSHLLGVNHFNIDATDWVHQIIIGEIARSFPPPAPLASAAPPRGHRGAVPPHAAAGALAMRGAPHGNAYFVAPARVAPTAAAPRGGTRVAALPAARATAWPPVIVRGTASPMPPRTYAAPATVAGNATAVPGNRPTAWGPGPHAWIEPSMAQPRTADLRTQSPFFNPPPQ